jgi:hypothetical protein
LQALASSNDLLDFVGTLKAYTDVVPDYFDDVVLVGVEATWNMPEGWAWQHEVKSTKLDLGYEVEMQVTFTMTIEEMVLQLKEGGMVLKSAARDQKNDKE